MHGGIGRSASVASQAAVMASSQRRKRRQSISSIKYQAPAASLVSVNDDIERRHQ